MGGPCKDVHIVPYNDLAAAKRVLEKEDVAVVLVEPAITNSGVILPAPGFLEGLYSTAHDHGTHNVLNCP